MSNQKLLLITNILAIGLYTCRIMILMNVMFNFAAKMTLNNARTEKSVLHKYMDLDTGVDERVMCEYIWIDGTSEGIRSKCRTLDNEPKSPKGNYIHLYENYQFY